MCRHGTITANMLVLAVIVVQLAPPIQNVQTVVGSRSSPRAQPQVGMGPRRDRTHTTKLGLATNLASAIVLSDTTILYLPAIFENYCAGPITDDFSSPSSGWPIGNTQHWSLGYDTGEYRLTATAGPSTLLVTRGDRDNYFTHLEADARQSSSVNGSLGLLFWLDDDWSSFVTVEIHPATQEWTVHNLYRGTWSKVSHDTSAAILKPPATNHISIGLDPYYDVRLNGTSVELLGDNLDHPSRLVGFMATSDGPGFEARFDNYRFVPQACPDTSSQNVTLDAQIPLNATPSGADVRPFWSRRFSGQTTEAFGRWSVDRISSIP